MKRILLSLLFVVSLLPAQEPAPQRRLLISGCALGYVAIIDPAGKVEWKMPEKRETSDTWLLPNGRILMAYKHGIKEIVPDLASGKGAKTVWERPTAKGGETHACQPLPDNRILIGESYQGVSYILEIDREGKEYARVELKGFGGKHNSFRQIRKTPQGTYLVTQQRGNGKALEIDARGKTVRTFPDGRFVATRLADGNTLIACGDAHRVIEVDPAGKIVWSVGKDDLDGISIGFASGLQRLPNGNTLLTNWGGHGGSAGPAILEITRDKKVVWKSPASIANRVSNIFVLGLPKAKIWR